MNDPANLAWIAKHRLLGHDVTEESSSFAIRWTLTNGLNHVKQHAWCNTCERVGIDWYRVETWDEPQ